MNSFAPPTMIRSVVATSRSLCVLGAPQRAHAPAIRERTAARGMSASNGANAPPRGSTPLS